MNSSSNVAKNEVGATSFHDRDNQVEKVPMFIKKLLRLLKDPMCSNTIVWEENDNSGILTVVQPMLLQKNLLPKYFKHSNLSSFVRQLNTHGFKKLFKRSNNDEQKMVYRHKNFLPNQSTMPIKRCKNRETSTENIDQLQSQILLREIVKLEKDIATLEQDEVLHNTKLLLSPPLLSYYSSIRYILTLLKSNSFKDLFNRSFSEHLSQEDSIIHHFLDLIERLSPGILHKPHHRDDRMLSPVCLFPDDKYLDLEILGPVLISTRKSSLDCTTACDVDNYGYL